MQFLPFWGVFGCSEGELQMQLLPFLHYLLI